MSSALLSSSTARHGGATCRASSGAACSTSGRPAVFASLADRRRRSTPRAPTPTLVVAPTPMLSSRRRQLSPPPAATFFDQAWGTQIDGQSLASQLFSLSLLPYLGFLYHLRKPEAKTPPLVFGGFCFLLVFVFATIPAGIYAKKVYGTSLANVDWLHGGAESLLTVTNLLLVVGLRRAIRDAEAAKKVDGGEASGDASATAAAAAAEDPASR